MIGRIRRLERVLEHCVQEAHDDEGLDQWVARPGWERVGEGGLLVWAEAAPERRARPRRILTGYRGAGGVDRLQSMETLRHDWSRSPLSIRVAGQRLKSLIEQNLGRLEAAVLYLKGNWLSDAKMAFAVRIRLKRAKFWVGLVRTGGDGERLLGDFFHCLMARDMTPEPTALWMGSESGGTEEVLRSLLEGLTGLDTGAVRAMRSWWAVYPYRAESAPGREGGERSPLKPGRRPGQLRAIPRRGP